MYSKLIEIYSPDNGATILLQGVYRGFSGQGEDPVEGVPQLDQCSPEPFAVPQAEYDLFQNCFKPLFYIFL
jgi:hypothetical protein